MKFTIQIPLFHNCNLDCDFCVEHCGEFNKLDYDYIETLGERLVKEHAKAFEERFTNVTELNIGFCGGELFAVKDLEKLKSSLRIMQIDIVKNVRKYLTGIKDIRWNWTSNFMFNNTDEIIKFFKEFQGDIHTSYDVSGRFKSPEQFKLWKKNFNIIRKHFGKRLIDVCFVFTKPNVEAFLDLSYSDPMKINFNNAIPKDIEIDFSYYVPVNSNVLYLMPSDDLIYKFFDRALELGMFNCTQVKSAWNTVKNPKEVFSYCDCFEGDTWMDKDFTSFDCFDQLDEELSIVKDSVKDKLNPKNHPELTSDDIRGCLCCEYNGRCQKMCYMMVCNKYYKTDSICPLYRIYKNIEDGKYDKE